ncbi:MAG TPA: hypothetical protein VGP48_14790 [Stellaceae bacterium]|nr:hypothetical protein [Stellaceae bacterium]
MAVIADPAATVHERANAQSLKAGLKKKLEQEGAPAGDWTDQAFRAGRLVQGMKKSVAPASSRGPSSEAAFRLGKALRRGLKKWEQM